jgi:polyisoprenyl-phosphate glycosyltransferase
VRTTAPLLSVIVAAYNEEECLPELFDRLRRSIEALAVPAELIFVDDGSTDASFDVIERLARLDPRVRGVRLSRNEGHQAALICGMDCARGDVAITLDADLQHPPEHIPEMLAAWRDGFDVVHMTRRSPVGSGRLREILTTVFYRLFNLVSEVKVTPRTTDFRLMDRRCLDALGTMRERLRFLRGMVRRIGFRQTELPFDCPARFAGTTSYTLPRLFRLAVDALVSFSSFPVFLPLSIGGITLVAAASSLAALVVAGPAASATVTWALAVASALLFGLSFVLLGLLGAYLSRLLVEVKGRPLYFVDRTVGDREPRLAGKSPRPDGEPPPTSRRQPEGSTDVLH